MNHKTLNYLLNRKRIHLYNKIALEQMFLILEDGAGSVYLLCRYQQKNLKSWDGIKACITYGREVYNRNSISIIPSENTKISKDLLLDFSLLRKSSLEQYRSISRLAFDRWLSYY